MWLWIIHCKYLRFLFWLQQILFPPPPSQYPCSKDPRISDYLRPGFPHSLPSWQWIRSLLRMFCIINDIFWLMRLDCNTSNVLWAGSTVRCWCGTKMLAAFQNNMGRPYIPRLAGDWQVFPLALRMLVSLLNGCLHEHRQCIQGSSLPVALIVPLEIKRILC